MESTGVKESVWQNALDGRLERIWGRIFEQLAEAIVTYLPDSSVRRTKELFGIVFQVTHDSVMGKAAYIRLFGGSLTSRDLVPVAGRDPEKWEKATQIRRIQGGKFLDVGQMESGEIAAVYGLSGCKAGDLIGGEGLNLEEYRSAMELQPLLMIQVKPVDASKEIELAAALTELSEEDPLLHYERNPLTEQMYLRVMGKVLGQIIAMRGEFSSPVIEERIFSLEAVAPLRDSMDYPVTFRSLTSGKGSYAMEFDSYRPCEEGFLETLPRRGVDPLDRPRWVLSCRSAY